MDSEKNTAVYYRKPGPFRFSFQEESEEEVLVLEDVKRQNEIVLYNDDVNTFDYVIEMLIDVCEHTPEQAEQCSIIVHYKGKCTVKTGPYEDLKPRCSMLLDAGLSAEIV
ncbi:ATP-dependent Clp protease adaptor ClpS [Sinomicrobium soli]|uniref:ATP-dependent Clp protease adaptor ClpS n=1 Tax=Sinomicrobium sp. N-1-3-6 TaxID=2219864 RepID=UPI000DCEC0D0|nr:ATP-dependent Clp protease adaptor ClpS [Sinomicrobium sp. N-1-3-6]RAV30114.1 ATP-dependent Clp protease adaptor ClpS [Sinomicrobium sp. N-1-3-6]